MKGSNTEDTYLRMWVWMSDITLVLELRPACVEVMAVTSAIETSGLRVELYTRLGPRPGLYTGDDYGHTRDTNRALDRSVATSGVTRQGVTAVCGLRLRLISCLGAVL